MNGRRWDVRIRETAEAKILLSDLNKTTTFEEGGFVQFLWSLLAFHSLFKDHISVDLDPPPPLSILFLSPVVQHIPISQCSMAQVDGAGPRCADGARTQPRAGPFLSNIQPEASPLTLAG